MDIIVMPKEEGYVAKLGVIPDGSLHKTRRRLFRR